MSTAVAEAPRRPGTTSERAVAFVAAKKPVAEILGRDLAELIGEPDRFAVSLGAAFRQLADAEYLNGQRRVAPDIGPMYGVRRPLIAAVTRGFRAATRRERTSTWLFVADRLLRENELEKQWFAFGLLERLVADEPERAWQLVRRAARGATDWITVDSLAHVVAKGILGEPYRWAELEQLVYSPNRWERRLVGSTIATVPFADRGRGRSTDVVEHGLSLIGQLIGDAEPDVQKALAWALRSLVLVDAAAVTAFCARQAEIAATTDDGHRAWVIRDALPNVQPQDADEIRRRLEGIRRRPGAASTSEAAEAAERFGAGLLGRPLQESPLT